MAYGQHQNIHETVSLRQNVSDEENYQILKRLEAQKLALDQSSIVVQADSLGFIDYVNEKLCEISEYSRAELIGQDYRIVNSGYHSKVFFQEMWKTISSGEIWRGEICNKSKSGSLYWVSATIIPFLDDTGLPLQYMAVCQDITELKNAQQKIIEQQGQLVSNSRLSTIGEMSAAITHEINNPLGVVLGRTEMLREYLKKGIVDPQKLDKIAEAIEVNGMRIEKIVRSMRSLAHAGADDPFLKTTVKDIINDALDLTAERVKNHGVRLKINEVSADLWLECRSHEILQVIVNLINNAFDAVQVLPEKWIDIRIGDLGHQVEFLVVDSGTGVPEHVAPRIFDPFFSTKRVQYGTGLGLAISKSLVTKHRGTIELLTEAENTTFRIVLPRAQNKSV